MAVPVDGQLLLLNQPLDGPVPEPIVLGPAQKLDILLDAPDPVRNPLEQPSARSPRHKCHQSCIPKRPMQRQAARLRERTGLQACA